MTDKKMDVSLGSGSQAEHINQLCKELLDDIELSRLTSEKLLLKCSRLARLAGSDEIQRWISHELSGYHLDDELCLRYMTKTGRWTDYKEKKGYWGPLAQQEASIEAYERRLGSMQLPSLGGDYANIAINNILTQANQISLAMSQMSAIRSRVLALLHDFVSGVYYQRIF
jgi:hypothetical protein